MVERAIKGSDVGLGTGKEDLLIGGGWRTGSGAVLEVRDRFTGSVVGRASVPSAEEVRETVVGARTAVESTTFEPYQRFEVLRDAALLVEQRRAELMQAIVSETGFTLRDAEGEVNRCVQTLLLSGEEAKRLDGEVVPIQGAKGQSHRLAWTFRVPVGVVCAITPFNSPLNTVAHKVAPALAGGNSVVLKPATYTPVTAALLCRILHDAGVPPGYLSLVQGGGGDVGTSLLNDQDLDFYTFTGSTEVGRIIQRTVGLRRTSLELGSISGTIVCDDADLDWAVPRCIRSSFRKAGQVCTSVQRLYVQEEVLDRFLSLMEAGVRELIVGDPHSPETDVGPMIAESEARRAEEWIGEAVEGGARIVCGGSREGAVFEPTILLEVQKEMKVMCREIFAPVISVVPFSTLDDATAEINATPYGLAAGIFTSNLERALTAARVLRMGSVHVNETSSARVDLMPYGGVKDSGFGREGPRYAIREMTEERLITMSMPSFAGR